MVKLRFSPESFESGSNCTIVTLERQTIDALLGIRVCDPAMGSGHFLVRAVDYLTDQIIHILGDFPERNPVIQMIEQVRQGIVKSVEEQGLTPDIARLSDTNLLRRLVMKRCIYGVDLNPMAVELAKLALWLHSFTVGAPLSFLDHHLRWGNSLIGARVDEVRTRLGEARIAEGVGQLELFGGPFARLLEATALMREVAGLSDASFAEVELSGQQFEAFEEAILPYKRVLDLWVARHFGVKEAENLLKLYGEGTVDAVMGRGAPLAPEYQQTLRQTHALWREKRFFHWELEFPEVFVDLERQRWKDKPGFDAVVGNPPYALLQGTELQQPLAGLYPAIHSGSNDLSHFFLAQGCLLLQSGGLLSYIVTRYWMEAHLSARLRQFLTTRVRPLCIVDFGNLQVWPDVNVLAIICTFTKSEGDTTYVYLPDEERHATAVAFLHGVAASPQTRGLAVNTGDFGREPWHLRGIETAGLWRKVPATAVPLHTITRNTQGVKTGANDVFTVTHELTDQLDLERVALIPLAQARDISRYNVAANEYLIYTDGRLDIDQVPRIREYLARHRVRLEARAECNRGLYPWWRLQRPRDRQLILRGPRILVPLYATENRFCFSPEVVVGMTDVYLIVPTDERYAGTFLSAVLNSRLLNSYHRTFCKFKRAGYLEYSGKAISDLPIRRVLFGTPLDRRAELAQEGLRLYDAYLDKCDPGPVLRFTQDRLSANPEETDVVHDFVAFLAENMLAMTRERHRQSDGFLAWLAAYTGLPISEWELRAVAERYWEHAWERLLGVLRRNEGRMARNPSSRQALSLIQEEWQESCRHIKSLLARIDATDRLIDLIVYALYGLTDEEAATVEGEMA